LYQLYESSDNLTVNSTFFYSVQIFQSPIKYNLTVYLAGNASHLEAAKLPLIVTLRLRNLQAALVELFFVFLDLHRPQDVSIALDIPAQDTHIFDAHTKRSSLRAGFCQFAVLRNVSMRQVNSGIDAARRVLSKSVIALLIWCKDILHEQAGK